MIRALRRLLGRSDGGAPAAGAGSGDWLYDHPLAELPALVLDTEATGLDVGHDRIVQVGAVTMRGPEFEDAAAFDRLVNPDRAVPAKAIEIHGIDDAMLSAAPRFAGICDELEAVASGRVWVGHNIGFDVALVAREMALAGRDWARPPALCTTQLFAALYPRARDLNLEAVAAHYGLSDAGRHSAIGDAHITAAVYRCILAELAGYGATRFADAVAFAARARTVIRHQRAAGW
jgi:DNA polymerase III subunit epsilon